jgi:pimeloyl-ACP methyl ester carboxylesterase
MVEASSTARRTQAALATITSSDLRPVLASLTTPIGVIWGESDRTVPLRVLDEVTNARPEARVVRLPGAGHVPMVEQPRQFADAVDLLLRELR